MDDTFPSDFGLSFCVMSSGIQMSLGISDRIFVYSLIKGDHFNLVLGSPQQRVLTALLQ